jgi:phosphinothricin acetyltransferase
MKIKPTAQADLESIRQIYNWHSEHGFSTFRGEIQTSDMPKWFAKFSDNGPYRSFVATSTENVVLGVACSFPYRDGDVFSHTLETSIYLAPHQNRKGIGSQLYQHLFSVLEHEDVYRAVVGIALPNPGSVALHQNFNFQEIGVFDNYAYYKGKFRSSLWMQKVLKPIPEGLSTSKT